MLFFKFGIFWHWIIMTFVVILFDRVLNYAFNFPLYGISYIEAAFISFVILWCDQQEKLNSKSEVNNDQTCCQNSNQTNLS